MKKGTTTPLPPSSTTGVDPAFYDIIDIIEDIWQSIEAIESLYEKKPSRLLENQINYYYNLSEYWEGIYLIFMGKKFYEDFF